MKSIDSKKMYSEWELINLIAAYTLSRNSVEKYTVDETFKEFPNLFTAEFAMIEQYLKKTNQ